jgi:hypothetical protein
MWSKSQTAMSISLGRTIDISSQMVGRYSVSVCYVQAKMAMIVNTDNIPGCHTMNLYTYRHQNIKANMS